MKKTIFDLLWLEIIYSGWNAQLLIYFSRLCSLYISRGKRSLLSTAFECPTPSLKDLLFVFLFHFLSVFPIVFHIYHLLIMDPLKEQ